VRARQRETETQRERLHHRTELSCVPTVEDLRTTQGEGGSRSMVNKQLTQWFHYYPTVDQNIPSTNCKRYCPSGGWAYGDSRRATPLHRENLLSTSWGEEKSLLVSSWTMWRNSSDTRSITLTYCTYHQENMQHCSVAAIVQTVGTVWYLTSYKETTTNKLFLMDDWIYLSLSQYFSFSLSRSVTQSFFLSICLTPSISYSVSVSLPILLSVSMRLCRLQ
jgi:hypothetical protein